MNKTWQPRKKTAQRYGVCVRSVRRWENDPRLDFPKAKIVNGRRYDSIDMLDAWDRAMAEQARKASI